MLDPIFSSADQFLRDPGPRHHPLGGPQPTGQGRRLWQGPTREEVWLKRL